MTSLITHDLAAATRPATEALFAVGVVVPVRDEEERVARAVRSVRRALAHADLVDACVVVVADSCTDQTVRIARRELGADGVVIEVAHANVGAARAEGSLEVMRRLGGPPRWTWLLGIDGDSEAATDWVRRHLEHAHGGIECVSGIVDLDGRAPAALRRSFRERYGSTVGSDRHDHIHGTNFGIRADTLLAAGNWPRLRSGEDRALWAKVAERSRPMAQDPAIVVSTSSRTEGRAPSGFAADLASLTVSCPTGGHP